MAIPIIENFAYTNGGTVAISSLSVTAPSGIQAGELLVIIICSDDNATGTYFNTVSGWTKQGESGSATPDAHIALYYKVATGTEGNVTVTATSLDNQIAWYLRISGVDTADIIEASNFATSSSTGTNPHNIPAITTLNDNCLALYGLAFDGGDGNPMSVAAPWTEADDKTNGNSSSYEGGCWGYQNKATAGSCGNAVVTTTGIDGAAYFQIAFNGASGEPPADVYSGRGITRGIGRGIIR